MSGFLFILVIDWIMRRTVSGANTGIRWKLWSKVDDLDFADDIALTSSTKCQIQKKVTNLSTNSKTTGLKINYEKTKLLRSNRTSNEYVKVKEHDIEDVESFVYLGAHISKSSGTEEDIKARLQRATKVVETLLGKVAINTPLRTKHGSRIHQVSSLYPIFGEKKKKQLSLFFSQEPL